MKFLEAIAGDGEFGHGHCSVLTDTVAYGSFANPYPSSKDKVFNNPKRITVDNEQGHSLLFDKKVYYLNVETEKESLKVEITANNLGLNMKRFGSPVMSEKEKSPVKPKIGRQEVDFKTK